jgi:outer membrane receptor protein involved in Fe transport
MPLGVELGVIGSHSRRVGERAYHLLDAQLRWSWRTWTVFASGTNLGDQRYVDVSAQTAPGRALGIGLRWTGAAH